MDTNGRIGPIEKVVPVGGFDDAFESADEGVLLSGIRLDDVNEGDLGQGV